MKRQVPAPSILTGGPIRRLTARMRFRSALALYLITGAPEDRERMIDRAADLANCGESQCRVFVNVVDLASLASLVKERERAA